jgi:hypothetical protein
MGGTNEEAGVDGGGFRKKIGAAGGFHRPFSCFVVVIVMEHSGRWNL